MDRDLVEAARRGDREAFAVLVHQVSDSLYAVAQRILRDTGLAEDALAKFDDGTYGECESCHRRIPEARLEAMPAARLCIECASQRR